MVDRLVPAVPDRYRALVALAGGTGLRWGECVGLRWDALDLDAGTVAVLRVAVEVAGTVTIKPYRKSQAGRRVVPLPDFATELLAAHREAFPPGPAGGSSPTPPGDRYAAPCSAPASGGRPSSAPACSLASTESVTSPTEGPGPMPRASNGRPTSLPTGKPSPTQPEWPLVASA